MKCQLNIKGNHVSWVSKQFNKSLFLSSEVDSRHLKILNGAVWYNINFHMAPKENTFAMIYGLVPPSCP